MPVPAGYPSASPRDLSCVYVDQPAAEHTVTDDDTIPFTGLQVSVHSARKLWLATAPFLAIVAIVGVVLTYRSSAHVSTGSEEIELEDSQNETATLATRAAALAMRDSLGASTMRNMTDTAALEAPATNGTISSDSTLPRVQFDSAASTTSTTSTKFTGSTTTTTTTTTKWHPDKWWLKHVFERGFSELCASKNDLMAPVLSKPVLGGKNLTMKVLTYNLFWWRLFDQLHGHGGSAGKVIAASNANGYFDVMAFQECRDKNRVLRDAGMLEYYEVFAAPYDKCMAYRKDAWDFLDNGHDNITHDVYWNDYGMRGAQWLRIKHKKTGHQVFFMNYHGGLSVNSGGTCGGIGAARNLLKLIKNKSAIDDKVILVGDFNSNPASHLVQELRTRLLHAYSGSVLGGIDNVLTNLPASSVVGSWNLGNGGSDHDALTTVFNLAAVDPDIQKSSELQTHALQSVQDNPPEHDWSKFWCGVIENNVQYVVINDTSTWNNVSVDHSSPDRCCRACQALEQCHAWMFEGIAGQWYPPRCVMTGGVVTSKVAREGVVSGLSYQTASATLQASLAIVSPPKPLAS